MSLNMPIHRLLAPKSPSVTLNIRKCMAQSLVPLVINYVGTCHCFNSICSITRVDRIFSLHTYSWRQELDDAITWPDLAQRVVHCVGLVQDTRGQGYVRDVAHSHWRYPLAYVEYGPIHDVPSLSCLHELLLTQSWYPDLAIWNAASGYDDGPKRKR